MAVDGCMGEDADEGALQLADVLLDPVGDAPAVGFQLRLARPTGADAATQPGHFDAAP